MRKALEVTTDQQLDVFVRTAQAVAMKNLAELEAQTAQAKLMLSQNGLMQTESNFLILKAHLGDYYDFEQARNLILNNAMVRAGLIWKTGITPFGEYNRQMVEQQEADRQRQEAERAVEQQTIAEKEAGFRLFVSAAHEGTLRGISVAPNRANWSLILDVLYAKSKPVTMENILWAIFQGNLNFAQDDTAQVHQQERQNIYASIRPRLTGDPHSEQIRQLCNTLPIVELRERIKLCEEIANNYSRSPLAVNEEFRKQMVSVSPNRDLQARVDQIRENRRLRRLTPAELRAEAAAARPQQPQSERDDGYRPIPLSIDGDAVVKASPYQLREWLKLYGKEQIDAKIREYKHLVTWQRKQLSNVDLGDE